MPVPDQPVRPSVEHLEGDHGAVRHEGTAIVETGCLVGQAPHPEAVQPMPHALPVGSDREGRAANQNGAPGRDRGFEHGSPLPGSVGSPEGADAKARGCRRVETERRIEQPPEPDLAGHAPPSATQDRRAIRRPRPTVDENSDLAVTGRARDVPQRRKPRGALSDTGVASSKRPSFPVNVTWRGKLTQTTAPATGAPAGSRTSPITRKGRGACCAAAAEVAHTTTNATPSPFGITRTATQLLRYTTLVPAELAVQGGGIDAEHLGGAGLVAALALQHPGDVGTLDHVEGGVGVRPLRDEGLDAALRQLVGQGREVDRRCLAEHHRPLEGVLELADVAGPVVGEQRALRVFRERLRLLVALLGDAAQELLPQDLDIVAPVAQWREMNGDHVQPVVQVGAETAALDVVLEVAVGGGHDPDVHGNGLGAAHGDRLPLLQHARQLHLRGGRHLADLVQEERAAARRGEQTLLVPNRTRERSLHVPEQLRLEEALRERAAVQRKESPVRARGQLAAVARDDLLPRARLSLDQHRALGGRHLLGELQHLLEGARLAQRLHEPGALAPPDLLLELLVLGLEEALLRRAPANRDEG